MFPSACFIWLFYEYSVSQPLHLDSLWRPFCLSLPVCSYFSWLLFVCVCVYVCVCVCVCVCVWLYACMCSVCMCDVGFAVWLLEAWIACNHYYCQFLHVMSQRGYLNLISDQCTKLCFYVRGFYASQIFYSYVSALMVVFLQLSITIF